VKTASAWRTTTTTAVVSAAQIQPSSSRTVTMVDVGVALTWIAISAASAKGLSAYRTAAVCDAEQEPASLTVEYAVGYTALHPVHPPSIPTHERSRS
jgi:hypothetical protein